MREMASAPLWFLRACRSIRRISSISTSVGEPSITAASPLAMASSVSLMAWSAASTVVILPRPSTCSRCS